MRRHTGFLSDQFLPVLETVLPLLHRTPVCNLFFAPARLYAVQRIAVYHMLCRKRIRVSLKRGKSSSGIASELRLREILSQPADHRKCGQPSSTDDSAVAETCVKRADSADSPDCLPILLSISVFQFLAFSVFHFLVVVSVRQIKLTRVGV